MTYGTAWVTAPLSAWPIEIIDGDRSSKYPNAADLTTTGVPFLNTTNISDWHLDLNDLRYISQEKSDQITKGKLQRHDIIMTTRGSIGRVARFNCEHPTALINAQMLILRPGANVDPDYLFYVLRSSTVQTSLKAFASGSAQPQLPIRDLRCVEITLPPVGLQRRIAEILGAYDDLIEVNRRRMAVLEEMARGLFEEWFIRFRFPGHEEAAFVDTADGPIPESWAWTTVGDVASYVNRGIAPRYDASVSTLVIGQKCVRNQKVGLTLARTQSKAVPAEKLVHDLDVLVNSTGVGTLGRVGQIEVAPEGLTVDSHVTIVRAASGIDKDWFGLSMLAKETTFELLGTGSTGQTELSRGSIAAQPVLLPGGDLGPRFGGLVRPMRSLAHSLQIAQLGLAASRDLLLPRLISGQLSVVEAERELAQAA